jgi:hypothetical protein
MGGKRKRAPDASAESAEALAPPAAPASPPLLRALRDAILAILRARSGSMCPSEAPRRLRPADWRCVRACVPLAAVVPLFQRTSC